MFFGADYYPEHWPKERWQIDAKLMREAEFNIVRLAEFAWAQMEPAEGKFDFGWLEEALDCLGKEGIKAVLGTPTASHPAWLDQQYPSVRRVDDQRRIVNFGNRQHACINAPDYWKASGRIVQPMAERFGNHEGVYGWQIDNEFGPHCYCDICQSQFQEWLEAKYGTFDALNEAWGTAFWGHIYSSWSQIPLPWNPPGCHNPGLELDYRRFMADSYTAYCAEQAEIIRDLSDKPITHNFMGVWPESLDYKALADQLDWASWDDYPVFGAGASASSVGMSHDITRGFKHKNFWVMEQQSGPGGWGELGPSPRPGQVRLYTYQSIAHGADGIVYFRWRVCRSGIEHYRHGILEHDGSTNRRYDKVKAIGSEMAKLAPMIEGTEVKAQAAIVNDYTSRWAWQAQKTNSEFNYVAEAESYYRTLLGKNVSWDIVQLGDDLSAYKLVIVPAMFIIRQEIADQFKSYVEAGGMLVVTYRTAAKDETSLMINEPLPGMLRDLFGVRVAEYHSPHKEEQNFVKGVVDGLPTEPVHATIFLDVLRPEGAQVLAEYMDGFASGQPAVTMNSYGQGKAVYIGTRLQEDFATALIGRLAEESGIAFGPESPEGVEIAIRRSAERELIFMMNYAAEEKTVRTPDGAKALIGPDSIGEFTLEPDGVRVFERK
jgi:beta-galactosidase